MITTLVFYVAICTDVAKNDCNGFEPYSWTFSNTIEAEKAYKECSILVNAYDQLEEVKETDCYEEQ